MDPHSLLALLETWGYAALLVLLIATGIGSPIPEDLLLLTAGYLIFAGVFFWPIAAGVCVAGVVGSDQMLYAAGRQIAWRAWRAPNGDNYYLSVRRLHRVTRWFARCGNVVILAARLVPGTRALVFITAGIHAIPAPTFLRYDLLGAALWVPAMLMIGYAAGGRIGGVEKAVDAITRGVTWMVAAAFGLVIVWLLLGREESKL
jgi:membrane protein DedA with SNARE-associated domain